MTPTPASGAADLPEALINIAREIEALKRDCGMDPESAIAIQNGRYMAISYKVRALAAGQATAAQAVVQDDLITIRRPTTRAEMLWLLKLAHLVISDVDKTLEAAFAPAQPAAQQGVAYAALPTSNYAGRVYEEGFLIGTCPLYTADQLHAFADATHMLRASHGQASSQAGECQALVCDYCGALTPDPWHSSGMLHGKMSKHIHSCDACAARGAAEAQASREQLTRERIQDLLLCGNPTDEEMRLIRIGWDAAHGIKGGQHGDATPQPTQPDPAYSAACNLATALFKKHFAHLPDFASGQAVWSLCDSMAGVILQIDNMVAGLVQPPTTSPQADSVPALDRDRIREIFMAYGFTVKEGQTDLKQYVYDAAEALLRAARDPADSVQEDAARYRCIRDVPYSDDVRSVLVHQQNAVMDRVIDAARKQGANP